MLNSLSQAAVIALCAFLIALVGLTWYKQGMPPFVPEHSNNGQAQGTIERDYSAEGEKGDSKASSTEGPNRQAKEKNENADAALANYTFWLTAFTAVLALATVALLSRLWAFGPMLPNKLAI